MSTKLNIENLKKQLTAISRTKKRGRNSPCPCGSGIKYKKCCMDKSSNEMNIIKDKIINDKKLEEIFDDETNCLCGSQLKFKNCCKKRFNNEIDYSISRKLYNEGNYLNAIQVERTNFFTYAIKHKLHLPLYIYSVTALNNYLRMDIEALSESVQFLIFCYIKNNMKSDVLIFLDEIKEVIDSELWRQRLIYHKITFKAFELENIPDAKKDLIQLGNVSNIKDSKILEVYLHLMNDQLSFREKIDICQHIIKDTDCSVIKLKYRTSIALETLSIGDVDNAQKELENALSEFKVSDNKSGDPYMYYNLGQSYYLLAMITKKDEHFKKALSNYLKELNSGDFTGKGKSNIWWNIGSCYHVINDLKSAKQSYLKSIDLEKSNLNTLDIIKTFVKGGELKEAHKWLSEIQEEKLNDWEKFDYFMIIGEISINESDLPLAKKTIDNLKGVNVKEPYFKEIRDKMVISLIEFYNKKDNKTRLKVLGWLKSISRTRFIKGLILQPNFFGIGFDFKKLFDDNMQSNKKKKKCK